MKRIRKILGCVLVVLVTLTGCNSTNTGSGTNGEKVYKIGISQFAPHGSLDNCREGFLLGLKNAGIEEGKNLEVDFQNAQAEMATATQIANSFVGNKVDLICAIATPSATTAYNAALESKIPVIFTAITDPIAAQLAKEDGTPVGEVTGTSDVLPVEAQLQMIRQILPEAKTIGILYTTSEDNSVSAIKVYEELAPKYDFKLETIGVSTAADIPLATDNILTKVDCLTNLTDNTVVNTLPTILEKANLKNIPIFGSEVEQVKIGCLAGMGIDYIVLGEKTGEMAAKILKGEAKASEMNFEVLTDPFLYINKEVAEKLGIEIDSTYEETAREVFEKIEMK